MDKIYINGNYFKLTTVTVNIYIDALDIVNNMYT